MAALQTYFTGTLFTLMILSAEAQIPDSTQKQAIYEDFGFYSGVSLVKLSGVAPGATLDFGFISGGRRFKYGFGYGINLKRADSGTQYLSAYGLTNASSIEVPHDSETGYSFISLNFRYYLKSTENILGSNFYGHLGITGQLFSMVVTNGKYNPDEYYVQDEIFNVSNAKVNRAMGYAARFGIGYEYTFRFRLSITSQLVYDLNFADSKYSMLVLPDTHAAMIGIGAKYTFLFSSKR